MPIVRRDRPLPREGTIARTVLEELRSTPEGMRFNDLARVYQDAQRRQTPGWRPMFGWQDNIRRIGLNLNRILKDYAYKTGKPGSQTPWKFGDAPGTMVLEDRNGRQMVLHGPSVMQIQEKEKPVEDGPDSLKDWPDSEQTKHLRAMLDASIQRDKWVQWARLKVAGYGRDALLALREAINERLS